MTSLRSPRVKGFTLIELVVGIVVMAVALTLLATLFFSTAGRSVEPMLQIRAAEFGQALMEEILAKPFDETTPLGGLPACTVCTASGSFGSDGESRANYDDVDDYHDSCGSPTAIVNALGTPVDNFSGYSMEVCVSYDGDFDGVADASINAKLIVISIFLPAGAGLDNNRLQLAAYKGNY
jgi:MSHA pilin protein MshD